MARILVLSDDGKATLADERHVTPVHLDSEVGSHNLLERLAWAVAEAEDHSGERARPKRVARRPLPTREGRRAMRGAATASGFGRSFD